MTALICGYTGCGDAIEPGERLPWRHTNGLRPNIRPHYAGPAPRSAADDLARVGRADRRGARLPTEARDEALTA